MNQRTKYKSLFFIISFALNLILIIPQISFAVWERVSTNGFDNKYNVEVTSMAVFNGYLYVGTNKFSIVPPGKILGTGDFGCEVWRSSNGITWEQVNEEGFGDDGNGKACSVTVFGDYLYVGTSNWSTGCEVLRSSDGKEWTQVNSDGFGDRINYDASSMIVFGNYLYVGTYEGVWCSSNGNMWTKVADEVIADSMAVLNDYIYARDSYNESIWRSSEGTSWTKVFDLFWDVPKKMVRTMAVFDGYLYFIADYLEYGTGIWDYGTEIWRSGNGIDWEKVNEDVFGDDVVYHAAPMGVFDGYLYLGTGNSQTGFGVWRSTDGITWEKVSKYRFGNIGKYATSMAVFGSYLYVGTSNAGNGCEIWRFDGIPEPHCPIEAIYGEHSEETELLRSFRDNVLNQTPEGQEIIRLYYEWSPAIVKAMEEDEEFKEDVKEMIDGILPLINIQVD